MKKLAGRYLSAYTELPGGVWFISAVALINRSGSMVLFFMTLYLTTKLGASVSQAGQMIGVYGAGAIIGAFLGGNLSDKYGPKQVMFTSLFFNGLLFIILGYINNLIVFAAVMFITGIIGEAFRPANNSSVADICPGHLRARGYGLNRLAINLGVTVGPAVGGYLATINYSYLFWVDGITCILASGLILYKGNKYFKTHQKTEIKTKGNLFTPLKDRFFVLILIMLLVLGFTFSQVFNVWPLYLKNICSLTEDKIGLLLAINALMVVVIEMPLIKYFESFDPLKIIFTGCFLLLLGFGSTAFGVSYWFLIFTVIIWTFGEMMVSPFMTGLVANRAPDAMRGKYMGLMTLFHSMAMAVGPTLGTKVYELVNPSALFNAIVVFSFISPVFYPLFKKMKQA